MLVSHMLKIRLQRVGRKNDPSFRIVVMQHQKDSQSGKFIEILGDYNARAGKPQVKADRIKHWLAMGAQASGTVHNILVKQKVIAGKKINVMPKRKPVEKKPEEAKAEVKTETPQAETVAERVEEKVAPTLEEVGVPTENVGKEKTEEVVAEVTA